MFEVFIESMSTARSVPHHSTPHAAAAAAAALLPCCPLAFHSVSFHASAFLPPVPLSFCQLGKYLHNVVVGLADGLPQRSLISRLASTVARCLYWQIYIAIYTDICARTYTYIYSYSACICLAMSCCRGSCCFL